MNTPTRTTTGAGLDRAATLEACVELVDAATRRANDAMENAIRRQSVLAEYAAYRLEEDALALEVALMHLEEAPAAFWTQRAHLTPEALLAAVAADLAAERQEEEALRDR